MALHHKLSPNIVLLLGKNVLRTLYKIERAPVIAYLSEIARKIDRTLLISLPK